VPKSEQNSVNGAVLHYCRKSLHLDILRDTREDCRVHSYSPGLNPCIGLNVWNLHWTGVLTFAHLSKRIVYVAGKCRGFNLFSREQGGPKHALAGFGNSGSA